MDRYFCVRFDVDTHRCIRKGVPNLLDLSSRIGVPFTFFVNMGRAAAPLRRLRNLLDRAPGDSDTAAKLQAHLKLGLRDALVVALVNPRVGAGSPRIVREILAQGHEVGLHGGVNHALWQADAGDWYASRLKEEVTRALDELEAATDRRPRGFASPGWTSPSSLPPILEEFGFRYVADAHGPGHPVLSRPPGCSRLLSVRTDICGEPGGVAYLEHLRARGFDDEAIREDFRERLRSAGRLAVVYDHPYFAGVRELEMIEELTIVARDEGFRVARLDEAVTALEAETA